MCVCTYDHANVVPCPVAAFFNCIIDDDIHEGIEASQNSNYRSTTVKLEHHSFVHESESGDWTMLL